MADISKCTGDGCRRKKTCYRFIATPCPYAQSYFASPPIDKKTKACEYYWKVKKK